MTEASLKQVHQLNVFADSFQFLVQDRMEDCAYPENWSDELASQLFVIGDKVVGVGTVRDLDVEVVLEIFDAPLDEEEREQDPDVTDWDQVIQCNLNIPSGRLLIAGPTEDFEEVARLDVPPGQYGIRVFWGNLDSIDDMGFEGDDLYKIMMWPNTEFEPRIIKPWIAMQPLMYTTDDEDDPSMN